MGSKSDMTSSMGMETVHQAYAIDYVNSQEEDFIDMIDPEVGYTQESELFCRSDSPNQTSIDGYISNSFPEKGYSEIVEQSKASSNGKKANKKKQALNTVGKAKFKSTKNRKEPWSCQFCDRKFTQRSSKHRHEKLHLGLKPHKCRYCDKAFTRKYILDEHERVHTGERPHRCTVCSMSYTLKSCLRKHELEHFGGQAHECVSCNGELVQPSAATARRSPGMDSLPSPGVIAAALDRENVELGNSLEEKLSSGTLNGSELSLQQQNLQSPGLNSDSINSKKQEMISQERMAPSVKVVSQLPSNRPAKSSTARRHKCYQCGKGFGSSRVLQMHKRVHECDGRFRCRFCGKAFSMRTVLQEHENQHKLIEEQSYSPLPPTESILHSFLQEAKEAQKKRDIESIQTQQQTTLQPLTVEANDPGNLQECLPPEKPYMCLYCMKAFRHTCSLVKHARKYRGSCFDPAATRPVPRNASHSPHSDNITSSSHMVTSVKKKKKKSKKPKRDPLSSPDPKYYRCNVCFMTFNQRTSWQIHKRKHTKGNQHLCHICDMAFVGKAQWLQHQHDHHSDSGLPVVGSDEMEVTDYRDNGFDEMPQLLAEAPLEETLPSPNLEHVEDKIGEDQTEVDEGVGEREVFTCVYCSKTFNTFTLLRTHQEELHQLKVFACPRCNVSFGDRADLQAHMLVHAEEKLYRCNVCKRSFVKEENYKKHLQHHTKDKRHKCQYCEKTFERNSYRLQHERTHTGERPFVCRFCSKTFAQRNSMQRHEIIHLGIKKYKCDICEKAFGRRESLQNHILTHTKDIKLTETEAEKVASGAGTQRNQEVA